MHPNNHKLGDDKQQQQQQSPALSLSVFPLAFPGRLWTMLEEAETSKPCFDHIVSWNPDGRSFLVKNKIAFEANILSKYFGTAKYTSFTRQLNLYGFRRLHHQNSGQVDPGSYAHPYFVRSQPHLCKKIEREQTHKRVGSSSNARAKTGQLSTTTATAAVLDPGQAVFPPPPAAAAAAVAVPPPSSALMALESNYMAVAAARRMQQQESPSVLPAIPPPEEEEPVNLSTLWDDYDASWHPEPVDQPLVSSSQTSSLEGSRTPRPNNNNNSSSNDTSLDGRTATSPPTGEQYLNVQPLVQTVDSDIQEEIVHTFFGGGGRRRHEEEGPPAPD